MTYCPRTLQVNSQLYTATYWQLAGQIPILDDLSHSDPIPLCPTHLLCNGDVEGPCSVVSKWGGLKEILREGKVEHGVALVWDSEGSCHIGRASMVSSWIDYPLKSIGRDKKTKTQSQKMTAAWVQTINPTFLYLTQAIHLVYKWVHGFVVHSEALVLSSRWWRQVPEIRHLHRWHLRSVFRDGHHLLKTVYHLRKKKPLN